MSYYIYFSFCNIFRDLWCNFIWCPIISHSLIQTGISDYWPVSIYNNLDFSAINYLLQTVDRSYWLLLENHSQLRKRLDCCWSCFSSDLSRYKIALEIILYKRCLALTIHATGFISCPYTYAILMQGDITTDPIYGSIASIFVGIMLRIKEKIYGDFQLS